MSRILDPLGQIFGNFLLFSSYTLKDFQFPQKSYTLILNSTTQENEL